MKKWEKKNKEMLNKNHKKIFKIIIHNHLINHKIYIFLIIMRSQIENNNHLPESSNHQFYKFIALKNKLI